MLRLIVRIDDAGMAANVGGAVLTEFRTFDLDLPEIERLLGRKFSFGQAQVIGVEVLPSPTPGDEDV